MNAIARGPSAIFIIATTLLVSAYPDTANAQETYVKARLSGDFPVNSASVFELREVPASGRILYTATSGNALFLASTLTDGSVAVLLEDDFGQAYGSDLQNLVISPDGEWIGYRFARTGDLIAQKIDGSDRQILTLPDYEGSGFQGFLDTTGVTEPFQLFSASEGSDSIASLKLLADGRVVINQFRLGGSAFISGLLSLDSTGGLDGFVVIATLPHRFNSWRPSPSAALFYDGPVTYRIDYEGESEPTELPGVVGLPVTSPSGEKFYYHSGNDIVVSEPGGIVRQFSSNAGTRPLEHVKFSPDETRIVGCTKFSPQLLSYEIATGALAQLNRDSDIIVHRRNITQIDNLRITPDGQSAVFSGGGGPPPQDGIQLFITPIGGGTITRLNSSPPGGATGHFDLLPDGSAAVSISAELPDQPSHLYLAPLNGGSEVALTENFVVGGDVDGVIVLSDGSGLIFETDAETNSLDELFFIPTPLATMPESVKISRPDLAGPGGVIKTNKISLDGNWVAYTAEQDVHGIVELYVASIDGSTLNKINPSFSAKADINRFDFSNDS